MVKVTTPTENAKGSLVNYNNKYSGLSNNLPQIYEKYE